ncbi:uncharacterized protein LOC122723711 [Manihot esculenta]|uniref:uncharacterized protein LOC122723711 n=1 Tax=Manihot esculenta TaxID=3983 RepID=UPI001CC39DB2|nr:uncharacterized protein LOC122723711 [Manihot esculenta]
MSYEIMQHELMEKWGVEVPVWQLYRAKCKARDENIGMHCESFKKLKKYVHYLQTYNPGTVTLYKLDGCHLKGPYGGIFLVAVILDGNRGVLPLAFSIVEVGCGDSWTFFLENLYSCIGGGTDNRPLTIMSDRQKGLIDAVKNIFSNASHRVCCRHLYMNFKKEFPGLMLRDDFWNAAKSTHSYEFWLHMKNLKPKRDQKPYDWQKCMVRLHRRFGKPQRWEEIVTPRTKKVLNKIITASRFLKLLPSRNEEYEVHEGPCRFAASLAKRTCSCGWWDISGLPCKHAARAIAYVRGNIEEFCHEYYTVQCYSRVYAGAIHPVPQTELELDNEHPSMLPPPLRRQPGRLEREMRVNHQQEEGGQQLSLVLGAYKQATIRELVNMLLLGQIWLQVKRKENTLLHQVRGLQEGLILIKWDQVVDQLSKGAFGISNDLFENVVS